MPAVPKGSGRRIGRPTLSESVDSRRLVLDAARTTFARLGYEATTNRAIAEAAGLTTGTLYHHFDSKADLFAGVYQEAIGLISSRFIAASEVADGFADRLDAMLEAAHAMNSDDRILSQFVGAAYVDLQRVEGLDARCAPFAEPLNQMFRDLVDAGISGGEIDSEDRAAVLALVAVLTVGLAVAASGTVARNRTAVDAINRLLRGDLLR